MDELKLFDYIRNFCGPKTDVRLHPSFKKTYKPFMINRVMSMSPKTCHLSLFMSQRPDIPAELNHIFWNNEIGENIFFNYLTRSDKISAREMQYIREYFECSIERAQEYIALMSKKQFETIIEIYTRRDEKGKKGKLKKAK